MIDENKLLEWLQDEYEESKHEGENAYLMGLIINICMGK